MGHQSVRELAGWTIALSALLLVGPGAAQETCIATGDLNGSGSVTNSDMGWWLSYVYYDGPIPSYPYQMDLNGNCEVNPVDFRIFVDCFFSPVRPCPETATCCDPSVKRCCLGDPNMSGGEPTISDVSAIIDALFITGNCDGICTGGADTNRSGGSDPTCDDITISDVSALIDCLFITGNVVPC
jgi:hypothetical protein